MPQRYLKDLDDRLRPLEGACDTQVEQERQQWRECVEDCAGDWEWAYLQVLVRLAREYRRERPVSESFCQRVEAAGVLLAKAIPRMEKQGLLQYRKQGLYGLLAATHLAQAKSPHTRPVKRLRLIEAARSPMPATRSSWSRRASTSVWLSSTCSPPWETPES